MPPRLSLLFLLFVWFGCDQAHGSCRFPETWGGRWFQSGFTHLLNINSSVIETKGSCVENDGDKYILEDRAEQCFRCVVIHEKHQNVLQYKETFCVPKGPLEQLCGEIAGDATLFSMFRAEAAPISCPFRGPFTFSYNRGSGECARPPSRVDSCAQDSRLRMRYQACADILGSESSTEELECLATWKDGSTRYLVGKLAHKMASSDEDKYRCFVYEKVEHGMFRVAQSGDATCNGLLSATEGSRTMRLTKEGHGGTQCRYPGWVTEHHHWRSLEGPLLYQFTVRNATLRVLNETADPTDDREGERAACHTQIEASDKRALIIAHVTKGCESGYVCMLFHRRDTHVVELQQSVNFAHSAEEACQTGNFDASTLPYITLVTAVLKPRKCPHPGRYTLSGMSRTSSIVCSPGSNVGGSRGSDPGTSLVMGCKTGDLMEFQCPQDSAPSSFSCHGSWDDNGTFFVLVSPQSRHSTGARRLCYTYTESGDRLIFTSVGDSCHRDATTTIFNASLNGPCEEGELVHSSSYLIRPVGWLLLLCCLVVNR